MNPLCGLTLEKARAEMLAEAVNRQAVSIVADVKYSLAVGRPYCILQELYSENAAVLQQNGFSVHRIAVTSNAYGSVLQHWVVFWVGREEIMVLFLFCSLLTLFNV